MFISRVFFSSTSIQADLFLQPTESSLVVIRKTAGLRHFCVSFTAQKWSLPPGSHKHRHPFWTCVLATVNVSGTGAMRPASRAVFCLLATAFVSFSFFPSNFFYFQIYFLPSIILLVAFLLLPATLYLYSADTRSFTERSGQAWTCILRLDSDHC